MKGGRSISNEIGPLKKFDFFSRKNITQGVRNRMLVELAVSQLFGLYPGRVI